MSRRRTSVRGTPAAAVLAGGLNRAMFNPETRAFTDRVERLARQTAGHGAMCPCDACKELRSL